MPYFQNKIKVFRKDEKKKISTQQKELVRPYINSVTIKLLKDRSKKYKVPLDNDFLTHKSKFNIFEQDFMLDSRTSFQQLREAACQFWGENPNKYKFFDQKCNEILVDYQDDQPTTNEEASRNMTVDKFFETFLFTNAILLLMEPREEQQEVIDVQKESIKILIKKNINDKIEGMDNQEAAVIREFNEEDPLNEFADRNQLAKHNYLKRQAGTKLDQITGVGSRSFLTFLVLLILLLFTLLLLFLRLDTESSYNHSRMIYNLFQTDFFEIEDENRTMAFLREHIGPELLEHNGTKPQLRKLSELIGPIRLRQIRTKKGEWAKVWKDDKNSWYYTDYNSDTKDTGSLCTTGHDWWDYKTEDQTHISRNIEAKYNTYPGDGFVVDFDASQNLTQWNSTLNYLADDNNWTGNKTYFDASVRAFFINFNLYNPSIDEWLAVEMIIEFTSILILPTQFTARAFNANLHETSQEKGLWAVEYLRFFLSFYLIICGIIMRYELYRFCWRRASSDIDRRRDKERFKNLFRSKVILKWIEDVLICVLILTNLILTSLLSGKSTQEIIDSSEYIDLTEKSYQFKVIKILDSIILLLIMVKIIHVFTIIKAVRLLFKTINHALKRIAIYFLIILPLIIAYALIGIGIYGPYIDDYSSFPKSILSVLKFIVGEAELPLMMTYNAMWTVIYVISLTMIVIYLIIASFTAIFIDAYEYVVIKFGYPDDETDQKWNVRNTVLWMTDVIPPKYLEMCGITTKAEKE